MAILKSGLGTFSGKIGGIRAWESNGRTIVASYDVKCKNPKTEAQMKQRLKLINILNNYRVLKPALLENFEGIAGNRNAATFFRKYNLRQKPVWLTKTDALYHKVVLAPYCVSQGIIKPIEYSLSSAGLTSNIELGTTVKEVTTDVTNLAYAILQNHEDWSNGDTLQIVAMRQSLKDNLKSDSSRAEMEAVTLIMTTGKNQPLDSVVGVNGLKSMGITIANHDGRLGIDISNRSDYVYALALVHGRGTGIKRLLSTQNLVLSDTSIYDHYASSEQMVEALKSYKTKMEPDAYLSPSK
ncbi:MAG: hypothetical protein PUD83_07800 [Bacteroidales bacterium]|nr:hypothetical protein [Bacteroidales bacterium]